MTTTLRAMVDQMFATIETMDVEAVVALFAEDAVFFDPHYPQPRMAGKTAIRQGLQWGMGAMKSMKFPIVNYFEHESGQKAVVEIATSHVLKMGMHLNFPQVFVIEVSGNLLTRVQAYEPYGPHGINNIVLRLTRVAWRLSGKL